MTGPAVLPRRAEAFAAVRADWSAAIG
jgi:hypothetical protein